jgi:hypothetical protein
MEPMDDGYAIEIMEGEGPDLEAALAMEEAPPFLQRTNSFVNYRQTIRDQENMFWQKQFKQSLIMLICTNFFLYLAEKTGADSTNHYTQKEYAYNKFSLTLSIYV